MDIKEEEDCYIVEYGWSPNIRFLEVKNVHMYDSDGKIVHCNCGKEASMALIAKTAHVPICSHCCKFISEPYINSFN